MHRLHWITALLLGTAALGPFSTPASAQLGRLKKMGADAIKEAAKSKAGLSEPSANEGDASVRKINAPITAERLDLVLRSIKPYVAIAEARPKADPAIREYKTADSVYTACVEAVGKKMDQATSAGLFSDPKYLAGIEARKRQSEALDVRLKAAEKGSDQRQVVAIRDTALVLARQTMGQFAADKCQVPFKPIAMLNFEAALEGARIAAGEGPSPLISTFEDRVDLKPTPQARKAMTREEFGKLRERIAVWAISQADPALQARIPKQFTAEEMALLNARNAELAALAELFKSGSLRWADWGDVSEW